MPDHNEDARHPRGAVRIRSNVALDKEISGIDPIRLVPGELIAKRRAGYLHTAPPQSERAHFRRQEMEYHYYNECSTCHRNWTHCGCTDDRLGRRMPTILGEHDAPPHVDSMESE